MNSNTIFSIGMIAIGLIVVFLWLYTGWITARIFRKRRRSMGAGFVLGFLFGPVGIVIAKLLPEGGPKKRCPACAELIKADAVVCKHCGQKLRKRTVKVKRI